MSTTWSEERQPLRCTEGVLFAIGFAAHLEVIITKRPLAVLQRNVSAHCSHISSHMVQAYLASKAIRMVFLLHLRFEILSFNPPITRGTQRIVQLMIVTCAVGIVADDVKIGGLERLLARLTYETWPVVTTGEPTVRRADGFTTDKLPTTSTAAFIDRCGLSSTWRRRLHCWRCRGAAKSALLEWIRRCNIVIRWSAVVLLCWLQASHRRSLD